MVGQVSVPNQYQPRHLLGNLPSNRVSLQEVDDALAMCVKYFRKQRYTIETYLRFVRETDDLLDLRVEVAKCQ